MSASPEERDAEWSARLPEIPKSTGVFWPSVWTGLLCSLFGLYLIITPSQRAPSSPQLEMKDQPESVGDLHKPKVAPGSRTLRFGLVDSKDSSFALGLELFAKEVASRTEGRLQVQLFSGGLVNGVQLDEKGLVEALRSGNLDLGLSTTSPLTNYNHLLDVFDLPFLFHDPDHAERVVEGEVGKELLACLGDKNLVGLGYMEVGFRIFSSSTPMPDFASFAGKRLRVMQSVTFTRYIKAIGGDAVPSPVDKIYIMGKEGYIDGADRTYPTYWDFHLYDIHRYITETHHAYSVKMILANKKLYDELSSDDQKALTQSAEIAARFQRKKQREADKAVKTMAVKEGIRIFELSPAQREKFLSAATELHEQYRKNQSEQIFDTILDLAKSPKEGS